MTHQNLESSEAQKPTNMDPVVSQKLFADLERNFGGGGPNSGNVDQLVKDGILPKGSDHIDLSAVQAHLTEDRKALTDMNRASAGSEPAVRDLPRVALAGTPGGKSDETMEALHGIASRNKQDAQVQEDFGTVSGAFGFKSDGFSKKDLERVASGEGNVSQNAQDAAERLLHTFNDEAYQEYSRGGMHTKHHEVSEYATKGGLFTSGGVLTGDSIDAAVKAHAAQNEEASKKVEGLQANKTKGDSVEPKLDGSNPEVNADNPAQAKRDQLNNRIKEEEAALKPQPSSVADRGRVVSGGGYYQVAENLLGFGNKHDATQEKEVTALQHLLQDEVRAENHGTLPTLKAGQRLVTDEAMQRIFDKIQPAFASHQDGMAVHFLQSDHATEKGRKTPIRSAGIPTEV